MSETSLAIRAARVGLRGGMRSRLMVLLSLVLSACAEFVGPSPSTYLLRIDAMQVDQGMVVSDVYTLDNTVLLAHAEAMLQNRGSSPLELTECGAEGERQVVAILVRRSDLSEYAAPSMLKEFCPDPTHRALLPGQWRRDSLALGFYSDWSLAPGSSPDPFHVVYLTRLGPLISHALPESLFEPVP